MDRKMFRSCMTTYIISNEEVNDVMRIVKSLEVNGLLIKGVKQLKTKQKHKKTDFLIYYKNTLVAS